VAKVDPISRTNAPALCLIATTFRKTRSKAGRLPAASAVVSSKQMHNIPAPLAVALFTSVLCAQPAPSERGPRPFIRTTGEATVTAKPDRAMIQIGVTTQAQNAQAAGAQNAARLEQVLRQLKSAAGPAAEIKTVSYSLEPDYRYPKPGGQPELAGYTARNVVQVTTPDLEAAGKIIDAATQSGANNIERLVFTLKDDQAARGEALRQATAKARANADAIAAALGVKITRVLSAEGGGAGPRPVEFGMPRMATAASMTATPVAPGTIEIHDTVTLTVEIAP